MKPVGNESPRRPFPERSENENNERAFDKDHVDNEPDSDSLMTTGEKPLKEDDSLERDQADEP